MTIVSSSPSISFSKFFKPHKNHNITLLPTSISPTILSCSSSSPIRLQSTHHSYTNSILHKQSSNLKKTRLSVTEEETVVTEQDDVEPTVTVPVSRSDMLTMFFKAEGTMSEGAIPSVTSALEGMEDVSSIRVHVIEGIASVELMKKTTVQATGVASNLVEVLQNSGFKLQTLNLSFDDDTN